MVNEPISPRDEEEKRLLVVLEQVSRRMRKELALLGDRREDVVGIRQEFWDDVRMNFSDSTEVGETWSSIVQQAELLAERERSHRVASEAVERLTKQFDSPYFARIDFAEQGADAEVIYIGRASSSAKTGKLSTSTIGALRYLACSTIMNRARRRIAFRTGKSRESLH